MKTTKKSPTSTHKRSIKTKPKPPRVKKGVKPKTVKKTKPGSKRRPSVKRGKAKKVVKKRRPVKKRPSKKPIKKADEQLPEDVKWLEDDPHDEILSRFIYDPRGKQVGETIGVEGKQLIVKNREKFYSIPLNSIHEKKSELVLRKKVNWAKAEKKGEKWRKKALDVIKPKK
jgi:hypothetical protein